MSALSAIRAPLVTVWPVLTEASHLLTDFPDAQDELLALTSDGTLHVEPMLDADVLRMRQLMSKYRDLPMGLADAALVSVAERLKLLTIFTTDQRDFFLYRTKSRKRFRLLPRTR